MKRLLFSWLAVNNDFIKEAGSSSSVNESGTTVSFHQHFFADNYETHFILSSARNSDTRLEFLLNFLSRKYPHHHVEARYLGIDDVIDMEQIRSKIEPLLLEFRDYALDLFISPGTPAMHTAWVLAHTTLGLDTRLLQVRPKQFTKSRQAPELVWVEIDKDATTSSAIIRQTAADQTTQNVNSKSFLMTESIKPIYARARQVAQAANATVLITGDTGTGKEHLARYIHEQSPRRNSAFYALNCSAMNDQLLESRLFGYIKGAFTGADKDAFGIIEAAEGGTLFLDEIGDISPYMQQTLLRVLQEKEIAPIGGKPKKIDVRFISATNRDLLQRCEQGQFRWDLFYRLSVVDLELPSLQERGLAEKKELIQFFLLQKKQWFNAPHILQLSLTVMERLLTYPFPGNIRELENLIERLYVLNTGIEAALHDLPARLQQLNPTNSLLLEAVESNHIEKVLRFNNGNQRKTARDIGVAYNTLINKLKKYGIENEQRLSR